jgi:hypothetical protein
MNRRDLGPVGLIVGLAAVAALTVAWLRSSLGEIAGKGIGSDRATKTEIKPVRW